MNEVQLGDKFCLVFLLLEIMSTGTLAPISVKLSMLAAKEALSDYKPGTPVVEIGQERGVLLGLCCVAVLLKTLWLRVG